MHGDWSIAYSPRTSIVKAFIKIWKLAKSWNNWRINVYSNRYSLKKSLTMFYLVDDQQKRSSIQYLFTSKRRHFESRELITIWIGTCETLRDLRELPIPLVYRSLLGQISPFAFDVYFMYEMFSKRVFSYEYL